MLLALAFAGCSFRPGTVGGGDGGGSGSDGTPPAELVTRRLVFDNSASTVESLDMPVLVALDATKINYSLIADPKTDLRFENPANGNAVAFEVEHWNPAGESIVWIKVPRLTPGSTTTSVLMHYGTLAAGSPAPVFSSPNAAYEVVQHFAPTLENAANAKYAGTAIGAARVDGQVGPAIGFSGVGDQRVTFADPGGDLFNGWGSFNMMFWIYLDYPSAGVVRAQQFMQKGGALGSGAVVSDGTDIDLQIDFHFTGNNNDAVLTASVAPRVWTFIAVMFDRPGATIQIYTDGVAGASYSMSGNQQEFLVNDVQAFFLGDDAASFVGRIDELRIEKRARTPDYVRAQHLSMSRRFVTFTDP